MNKKVLLVDDEIDIIDILKSCLEEHFYDLDIEHVSNGLDAFITCQNKKFDLIISDHKMPFMTGAAFVVGIRTRENQNKNTNVIILSGFLDEEIKASLNPQKVSFLGKPFEDSELISMATPFLI